MKSSNHILQSAFRKRIIILVFLIISIVLCFIFILFLSSKNNSDQYTVVNVLGRQRMLTQMMAKDVNRKYTMMQALENGALVLSDEELKLRIQTQNQTLKTAQEEFNHTLSAINQGVLISDDGREIDFTHSLKQMNGLIDQTNDLWGKFDAALNTVISNNQLNTQTAQALIYVNENNEKLLDYCDQITRTLVDDQKQLAEYNTYISVLVFVIFLLALVVVIYQIQKYIVKPLNEMYEGITNINLFQHKIIKTPTKYELKPVITEINNSFDQLNKLALLIRNINRSISFQDLLTYIYNSFSSFIPYSHIGIALLKDGGESLEASFGISEEGMEKLSKNLLGTKVRLKDTSVNQVIQSGRPRVINDLQAYTKNTCEKIYNRIILDEGILASVTLPLEINNKPIGVIFFSSKIKNIYREDHVRFLETLAESIAISIYQNIFIDELLYGSILAFAKMAEARDGDTGEHLDRMKRYSQKIAGYLMEDKQYTKEISAEFVKSIERFSPMHDIGKVGIRDGILLKPDKLTAQEFELMKKHTIYGADILRTAEENIKKLGKSILQIGIEIAEGHHERWDGCGYPYGRKGEEIPLSARIVAVGDVFDALTSKRIYKEAFSFEKSYEMIIQGSKKQFDPLIIETVKKHKMDLYNEYMKFQRQPLPLASQETEGDKIPMAQL